jgi:hypothetical protein
MWVQASIAIIATNKRRVNSKVKVGTRALLEPTAEDEQA